MFGRRKLDKVGVRAFADVLAAEQSAMSVTIGNPNLVDDTEVRWKLTLRVTPENEPAFETQLHALLPQTTRPRQGTRLAVRYDPKDHSRVQLDHRQAADTVVDAVTTVRPDLAGAQVMGMPLGDVIRQAMADPNAFRAEMLRRGAEVQHWTYETVQACQGQAAQQFPTTPPPRADPIDRLERLAALKERGLLTDEEFEQEKRKILGG
ncbi:hypothetical protein LAUMK191_03965 [Mycobacterium attenuatum]|uniref:SHOCT domain-containing protein n=1 Tax=Mycobacterium attenuatum TaxID=2341086 RepID=UPI000F169106|nr:SHOCT domain-containing protein [Mycobacterium attenuatum]VBA57304.1 hypothetical protein LAUMK191_03965 [Mycobacterium attenuatum]